MMGRKQIRSIVETVSFRETHRSFPFRSKYISQMQNILTGDINLNFKIESIVNENALNVLHSKII